MSEEKLSKELLNHYLLGDLSESEAEAVEARFFADGEYLYELLAARNDLLDAGLKGELQPPEVEQLNAQLRSLPALRDKAAFAHSLQLALSQHGETPDRTTTATPPSADNAKAPSLLGQSKSWFAMPRWGWATATLLLILGATGLVLYKTGRWRVTPAQQAAYVLTSPTPPTSSTSTEKQTPDPATLVAEVPPAFASPKASLSAVKQAGLDDKRGATVVTFVLSPGLVREAQDAPELEVAVSAEILSLQLELAPPIEHPQMALLKTGTGAVVWQHRSLGAQVFNGIRVAICNVPTANLSDGAYQLHLSQTGESAEAVYYFRFKKL